MSLYYKPAPLSVHRPHSSKVFSSETTGPIKAKFHMEPQWEGGMNVCSLHLGHMTKIATMPKSSKNPLKVFFSGTKWPWGLICSIGDLGPVKF